MSTHVPDIDNDGKKFNEDAYFRKLGLTKAERTSNDRWKKARQKYREGAIPHMGQTVLDLRSANDWLQRSDEPAAVRKLFGDFWLEGELAILFADTGKGKSILAVQIAESLASGRPIEPFEMDYKPSDTLGSDWPQTPILYLDFELSTDQFNRRYSIGTAKNRRGFKRRRFHRNFIRAELRTDEAIPPALRMENGKWKMQSMENGQLKMKN